MGSGHCMSHSYFRIDLSNFLHCYNPRMTHGDRIRTVLNYTKNQYRKNQDLEQKFPVIQHKPHPKYHREQMFLKIKENLVKRD